MKIRMTLLALMITAIGFGQDQAFIESPDEEHVKVEINSFTVTVDSEKGIQSLKLKDIEEIFELSDDNTSISLKIICKEGMLSGIASNMSLEAGGNTNDIKTFIKEVKKIKKLAINFYKEKSKK